MTYRNKLDEIRDRAESEAGGDRPVMVEPLETRRMLSATAAGVSTTPNLSVTPSASAATFGGYTPAQIRKAYGFDQVQGDGTGQTIAIVDAYDDPNIAADLKAFSAKYGLPDANLIKVNQNGGSTKSVKANKDWAGEIALDVEWAHAIAPGATILLVEANSASLGDLMTAVNTARNYAGVSVVSMSWGTGEFFQQTAYDKYFTTPSGHQGVTFVASAGDDGSWYGPEWPSSSANVLAVGGTSLALNADGSYAGESAWSGGGGGVSRVVREPSYQVGVQSTGARSAPDVSYDANPSTGFAVYDSYGSGGWTVVGGTSAGAPQWAALVALANQARVSAGKATLDGATGTLPALYSLYNSSYAADFNDVARGATSWSVRAAAGYDAATGLGTPKAGAVVTSLVGASATTVVTTVKTTTTTTKAVGRRYWFYPFAVPATEAAVAFVQAQVSPATYVLHADGAGPGAPAVYDALVGAAEARPAGRGAAVAETAGVTPAASPGTRGVAAATVNAAGGMPAAVAVAPTVTSVPMAAFANVAAATAGTSWTFARADSTALISDAVAAFTREVVTAVESSGLAAASATMWSDKRWVTTAAVLAADAVMVGYYVRSRKEAGRRRVVTDLEGDGAEADGGGRAVEFSLVPLAAVR